MFCEFKNIIVNAMLLIFKGGYHEVVCSFTVCWYWFASAFADVKLSSRQAQTAVLWVIKNSMTEAGVPPDKVSAFYRGTYSLLVRLTRFTSSLPVG